MSSFWPWVVPSHVGGRRGVLRWRHHGHTLKRRLLLSSGVPGSRAVEAPQGDASHSSVGDEADEAAARTLAGRAGPCALQPPMSKALRHPLRPCPRVPPAGPCTDSAHGPPSTSAQPAEALAAEGVHSPRHPHWLCPSAGVPGGSPRTVPRDGIRRTPSPTPALGVI